MSVPVSVFNMNVDAVNVNINNAPQSFSISGATPATGYYPNQPTVNPTFGSQPAANVLGPGLNSLALTPEESTTPMILSANIPTTVQIASLQLYLFWDSATTIGYVLLNNGQVLISGSEPFGSPSLNNNRAQPSAEVL
jgi:hypothetical protein